MPDWEGILSRHGPAVWGCAFRLLGRQDDAEECFQETFLAAIRVWQAGPVEHERALLMRLATARAMDQLRRRYRRTGREESAEWETVPGASTLPSEQAEAAELSAKLREALAQLPPKQAEVFCFYSLDGWTYQEIADHLGVTVDSVGVTLHRARGRLKKLLASSAPQAPTPQG